MQGNNYAKDAKPTVGDGPKPPTTDIQRREEKNAEEPKRAPGTQIEDQQLKEGGQ